MYGSTEVTIRCPKFNTMKYETLQVGEKGILTHF